MEIRCQLIVEECVGDVLVKKTHYYRLTVEEYSKIINSFRDELLRGKVISMSHNVYSSGQLDEIIVVKAVDR